MKAKKLDITVDKVKKVWADVTVHRDGKKDLKTRTKKDLVADMPVGERIPVMGEVKWDINCYGSTSELFIYTDADLEEEKKSKAAGYMDIIRKKAAEECYLSKNLVKKIHELGITEYDEEFKEIEYDVATRKWIHFFRCNYDDGNGYFYDRAVYELHNLGCHDYDDEIESVRKEIEDKEKQMGIVEVAIAACLGRPGKNELFINRDRVYRAISSTYNDGDGWSFGTMSDEWYSVKAIDVTESEEGKAKLLKHAEELRKCEEKRQYEISYYELCRKIREAGSLYRQNEILSLSDIPGEEIYDSFNIYGSGNKIRVADNEVFLIENNGMDGDCWDVNNICTGGAGAYAFMAAKSDVETELDVFIDLKSKVEE